MSDVGPGFRVCPDGPGQLKAPAYPSHEEEAGPREGTRPCSPHGDIPRPQADTAPSPGVGLGLRHASSMQGCPLRLTWGSSGSG